MAVILKKIKLRHLLFGVGIVSVFVIGFCTNNILGSSDIAVVNLKQVVGQSQKLMQIRQENNIKLNELSDWLDGVEKELISEKDKNKRRQLAKEYKKLAKEKEKIIKQEYNKKIQEVEDEITNLIDDIAVTAGCEIILDKNSVIKGGVDITTDVIQKLNSK